MNQYTPGPLPVSECTPGPWRVTASILRIEEAASGRLIASMPNQEVYGPCLVNARLIARAPEMKEALAQALDTLYQKAREDGDIDFWNKGGPGFEACETICALLRAIEGE